MSRDATNRVNDQKGQQWWPSQDKLPQGLWLPKTKATWLSVMSEANSKILKVSTKCDNCQSYTEAHRGGVLGGRCQPNPAVQRMAGQSVVALFPDAFPSNLQNQGLSQRSHAGVASEIPAASS